MRKRGITGNAWPWLHNWRERRARRRDLARSEHYGRAAALGLTPTQADTIDAVTFDRVRDAMAKQARTIADAIPGAIARAVESREQRRARVRAAVDAAVLRASERNPGPGQSRAMVRAGLAALIDELT